MTTHERAVELCRRLSEHVRAVAPPGLGHCEGAKMEAALDANDAFFDALHEWEHDTDPQGRRERVPHVQALYDEVLAAWAMAASEYLAARPAKKNTTPMERRLTP